MCSEYMFLVWSNGLQRNDIKYKEWDRVLKNYKDIIPELRTRLK